MNRSKDKLRRARLQEDRRMIAYERIYARVIQSALNDQVNGAISSNGVVDDQIMMEAIRGLYRVVATDFLKRQYDLLDKGLTTKASSFFMNTWRTWIESYVFSELAKKVADINDTTRNKVRKAISIGMDQGLEWEQIAKLIRDKVGLNASNYRSIMIARTEVANAVNMAKAKSGDDFERETGERIYKLWIHRYARSPRDWHQNLDNDRAIPKEQNFIVYNPNTGRTDSMAHPHSSGASAENVINCSCTVMYVSESFARSLI